MTLGIALFGGFISLVLAVLRGLDYLRERSERAERPLIAFSATDAVLNQWGNNHTRIQTLLRARNTGRPTAMGKWRCTVNVSGETLDTVLLCGQMPIHPPGAPVTPLPSLDDSLGAQPLIRGGERCGMLYVLVAKPWTQLNDAMKSTDIPFNVVVQATDEFNGEWSTTVDVHKLGTEGGTTQWISGQGLQPPA